MLPDETARSRDNRLAIARMSVKAGQTGLRRTGRNAPMPRQVRHNNAIPSALHKERATCLAPSHSRATRIGEFAEAKRSPPCVPQYREERLMKRASKIWHTIGAFSLVFGLSAHPNVASGQNLGNPGVVPPSVNEFGNPYGEWTARWWQWLLSIPAATNPNLV